MTTNKHKLNTIIHTITHTITHTAKRLITWPHNRPDAVVNARPIHRDTHLNSSKAISIYLAMMDRPTTLRRHEHLVGPFGRAVDDCLVNAINAHSGVTPSSTHEGGGTSLEESE